MRKLLPQKQDIAGNEKLLKSEFHRRIFGLEYAIIRISNNINVGTISKASGLKAEVIKHFESLYQSVPNSMVYALAKVLNRDLDDNQFFRHLVNMAILGKPHKSIDKIKGNKILLYNLLQRRYRHSY
jgi:hypothetical protein